MSNRFERSSPRTHRPTPILKPGASSPPSNVFARSPSLAVESPNDRMLLFAKSSCLRTASFTGFVTG